MVVYTPGDFFLPLTAVRNAPNPNVYASGSIVFGGVLAENDKITISIGSNLDEDEEGDPKKVDYTYTVKKNDTYDNIVNGLVELINAGEGSPYAIARAFTEQQASYSRLKNRALPEMKPRSRLRWTPTHPK